MTIDDLKLQRDGWLWAGPKRDMSLGIRPVFAYIQTLPNGNILTTDGGIGAIEWGPRT